jgi:hypothetical protein
MTYYDYVKSRSVEEIALFFEMLVKYSFDRFEIVTAETWLRVLNTGIEEVK